MWFFQLSWCWCEGGQKISVRDLWTNGNCRLWELDWTKRLWGVPGADGEPGGWDLEVPLRMNQWGALEQMRLGLYRGCWRGCLRLSSQKLCSCCCSSMRSWMGRMAWSKVKGHCQLEDCGTERPVFLAVCVCTHYWEDDRHHVAKEWAWNYVLSHHPRLPMMVCARDHQALQYLVSCALWPLQI
jgi:hypothetical protein